ncbi:MAG: PAS domain S-box protein [Proteobacteria bacterium]|nr:PAS domain S-box protein [Pseudomonadota bacterium]
MSSHDTGAEQNYGGGSVAQPKPEAPSRPSVLASLQPLIQSLAASETRDAVVESLLEWITDSGGFAGARLRLQPEPRPSTDASQQRGQCTGPEAHSVAVVRGRRLLAHLDLWDDEPNGEARVEALSAALPWLALALESTPTDAQPRHRLLIEHAADVVCELASDGRLRYMSPSVADVLGHPPAFYLGKSFVEFVHPDDREVTLEAFSKLVATGKSVETRFRSPHAEGHVCWIWSRASSYRAGGALYVVAILRSVTTQVEAEQRLLESQARYRTIVENASDVILVATPEGLIHHATPNASEVLRVEEPERLTTDLFDRVWPEDRPAFANAWAGTQSEQEPGRVDFRLPDENGTPQWYEASWRPFEDAQGEPLLSLVIRDIGDRKRTEDALRDVAQGLASPDGFSFGTLTRHLAASLQADAAILGLRSPDDPSWVRPVAFWIDGAFAEMDDYPSEGAPCANVLANEICCYPTGVQRLFPADEMLVRERFESYVGAPLTDEQGSVVGLVCALSRQPLHDPDMARSLVRVFSTRASAELQRDRAGRALTASEERFRALAENAQDVIFEMDAKGRVLFSSPNAPALFGTDLTGTDLSSLRDLVHEGDVARVTRELKRAIADQSSGDVAFRLRTPDAGDWRWCELTVRGFLTEGGMRRGVVVLRDITQRTIAEEATQRLISITQNSSDLILLVSLDGSLLFLNPAGQALLGFESEEEARGASVFDLFMPENAKEMRYHVMPTVHRAQHWSGELQLQHHRHARTIPTLATLFLVQDPRSLRPLGIAGIFRDISERKHAERALREIEERYRSITENTLDLIAELSDDGSFVYASPNYRQILGYGSEDLLGRDAFSFLHPDDGHARSEFRRAFEDQVGTETTYRYRHRDGTYRWLETSARPYVTASGRSMIIAITRDITARRAAEEALRRSEEQLRQSQKMDAIGRLAGGVAHDFNNLLTAITGYCDLLLEGIDAQDPARDDAEEILRAAERAGTLTRQLLAFSRRQVLQPRVLDLNALLSDVDRMLRRLLGEDVELVTMLDGELWRVKADPGQLEQVVLNLVVNARDAMPDGGRITIQTSNVVVEGSDASHPDVPPGEYAMLAVRDDGVGMDENTSTRIFEPFFTTKPAGRGTGLGLSTVYGIVSQSQGALRVTSHPEAGSTFFIYLPRVGDAVASPDEATAPPRIRGSETILVVEDADSVRSLVRRHLERQGYTVLEARSGVDALRLCRRHEGPIQLLLTDVVLPGLDGREIARRAVELRAHLPVLYMSGFTEDHPSRRSVLDENVVVLEKPFTPATMLRRVRQILDASAAIERVGERAEAFSEAVPNLEAEAEELEALSSEWIAEGTRDADPEDD